MQHAKAAPCRIQDIGDHAVEFLGGEAGEGEFRRHRARGFIVLEELLERDAERCEQVARLTRQDLELAEARRQIESLAREVADLRARVPVTVTSVQPLFATFERK
jgi:hypothetical protein